MLKIISTRLIALLLFAVICFSGYAQNTLDRLGLSAATPSAVSFSLRKLSSSYLGAAIQVRRTIDNTVQNIGFDINGNLDTAALLTWVGSGSGFVSTWYDQSGNGLNATQALAANQPRIVNAGAIDRRNSKPTLVFSGGQFLVTSANYSNTAVFSTNAVSFVNTTNSGIFQIGAFNTLGSLFNEGNNWIARSFLTTGGSSSITFNTPTQLEQLSATYTNGNIKLFRRGVVSSNIGTSTVNTATNSTINIGNLTSTHNLNGGISELIIYNSLLSNTNRQTVETNQFSFYKIATTTIWSNTGGGNWRQSGTWVGGVVPGPNDDVVIATTGNNRVRLNQNNVVLGNLTINSGASFDMGTNTIATTGSCVNNGTVLTANTAGILFSLGLTADKFFTTSGTIDYDGNAAQSISSLTYGNLLISNTTAATTLAGTTTVDGTLTINTNAILDKLSVGLTVNNTITNNGSLRSTGGRLTITGGIAYNLAFAAGKNVLDTLVINRSQATTLTAPLTVNNLITLTNGLLTVPAGNLTLSNNAIVTGGSATAFINGQVIVNSNAINARNIPLGKNNVLGSISLIPSTSAASTYTLEYFNGVAVTPNSGNLGAGIAGVASNQYWRISKTGANASLIFNYNSSPGGTNSQQITLANYNGIQWVALPTYSSSMANAINGQVITQSTITGSYGDFGLGFINAIENGLDGIGLTTATPAAAAYGLRKLRSVYKGAALRIRRSNDNVETSIGFDANGNIDTTAIKTFTGVSDAFVTTWYDQSGNNRNLLQNTMANQPRIVLAGVIDRKNGQPAIRHLAANAHNLNINTADFVTNNNPWSMNAVMGLDGGANGRVLSGSNGWFLGFDAGGERRAYFGNVWLSYNGVLNYNNASATTNNQMYTAVSNGSSASVFNNGLQLAGTVPSGSTSIGTLFTGSVNGTSEFSNCVIQEVIVFSSALSSANRAGIERNQGLYYAIGNFAVSAPAGGNWSNPATWENGVVPSASSDVVINATSGAVVLNVNTAIRSINNAHLATLNLGAANTITTSSDVNNFGTLITANPNGLIGSGASLNIGGIISNTSYNTSRVVYNGTNQLVNPLTYSNLSLINASSIKTLLTGAATTVSDTLYLENGITFNKSTNDLNLACLTGTGLLSSTGGLLRFNFFSIANIGTLHMAPAPNNAVASFVLSNSFANTSITLGAPLAVTTSVALDYGILNSNGFLTLISDSLGTARVATLVAPAQITGNVIVQRYIPAVTRRTRLLTSPVSGFTYNQLIDDIFVSGPNGGVGFDIITNATINTYNEQTSNGRGNKPVQNINDALLPGKGAFVFIRGDRSLPSPQWYTPPFVQQNAVTLDFVGPINQGVISPQITFSSTGTVANDGWNIVGNPYPSPIDWDLINKTGLTSFYYSLDPSSGTYVASSAGVIASGQAVLVKATSANPTITFNESSKVSSSPINYFKTSTPPLTITMKRDALNSDVAMISFRDGYSKSYNNLEDAIKLTNANINLSLYADTIPVQINGLPLLASASTDTLNIGVDGTIGNYTLRFNNLNSLPSGLNCYLIDRMLNTTTPILNAIEYPFAISNNIGSIGKRFAIVFSPLNPLPIKLLSFNATSNNNNVVLNWRTASELNMQSHILERKLSTDLAFKEIAVIKPKTGAVVATSYTYNDAEILNNADGLVCYRIKLVEKNKSSLYSHVVCFDPSGLNSYSTATLLLLPNPVKVGEVVNLKIEGIQHDRYEIHVVDQLGRVVHEQTSSTNNLSIDNKIFSSGIYNILLLSDGILLGTSKLSIH